MIPPILHRTVPADTTLEVEAWWAGARKLHPAWTHLTWRDPLDPSNWPLSSPHWGRCTAGAQMAGLIRLEALIHSGGVYIDSDVELYRPLDPFRPLPFFATWEDETGLPDFVFGAERGHPLLHELLAEAVRRLDQGPAESGPGAFKAVLAHRTDVLMFPPQTFCAVHYLDKALLADHKPAPYEYASHKWAGSWVT